MKNETKNLFSLRARKGSNRGFSLLEYCAGAAVLVGIIWAAVNTMGGQVSGMVKSIGDWAGARTTQMGGGSSSGGTGAAH